MSREYGVMSIEKLACEKALRIKYFLNTKYIEFITYER